MKMARLFAALGLLGSVAASMPADAASYVIPGIACKAQDPDLEHQLQYWYYGSVENSLVGGIQVPTICPLPRHNASAHLSGTANIKVYNETSSTLNCSFSIVPANATSGDFVAVSATSAGFHNLAVNTTLLTPFTNGRYLANCFLDTGDEIDSIRYNEP